jgi:hypothetical protein
MLFGGVVRLKFECGLATNRSATRRPISCGEVPGAHGPKSNFASAGATKDNSKATRT